MGTRLKIDIANGAIEVEGTEEFVRKIYEEFKDLMSSTALSPRRREFAADHAVTEPKSGVKRARKGKQVTGDASATEKVKNYAPALDSSLDTTGLESFYSAFAPKNHPERILIFARFLEEKKGIAPCTGNQVFTCYRTVKEKIPEAFVQALRDASGGRYGYIDYVSPTEIKVTVRGTNHFEQGGVSLKANGSKAQNAEK